MITTISSSEKSRFLPQYRLAMRQNLGYFGLLSVLIFLCYPLQFLMEITKKLQDVSGYSPDYLAYLESNLYHKYDLAGIGMNYTGASMILFTMLMLVMPVVLAMLMNNYMHSKKAADVYHALPVRREALMGANALAAMTMLAVPLAVSYLIIAVATCVKFGFDTRIIGYQILDFVVWMIIAFLIYVIVTAVATQVGTAFDTLWFSGILFFVLPALLGTYLLLGNLFLYGFPTSEELVESLLLLSPVLFPINRLLLTSVNGIDGEYASIGMQDLSRSFRQSNITALIYLLLAAVLLFLAMKLYVRRPSERAETTTSKGVLPLFVQGVGTILASIYCGLFFYAINWDESNMIFIIWAIIGGMLAFTVLEVILNRGFKTLLRALPMGAVMVAVAVGVSLIMMTGGFGYENRVPALTEVASITLEHNNALTNADTIQGREYLSENSWRNIELNADLTDDASKEAVARFHQAVVQEGDKNRMNAWEDVPYVYLGASLTYHLNNGRTVQRYYSTASVEATKQLLPLLGSEEYLKNKDLFFAADAGSMRYWELVNGTGTNRRKLTLTQEESAALLKAVQTDMISRTQEDWLNPSEPLLGIVGFEAFDAQIVQRQYTSTYGTRSYSEDYADTMGAYFPFTERDAEVCRFLRDKGLMGNLTVDLEKCIAVSVKPYTETDSWRSALVLLSGQDAFSKEQLGEDQKWADSYLENMRQQAREYDISLDQWYREERGEDAEIVDSKMLIRPEIVILEDKAEIRELASHIASSFDASEAYVKASFYMDDGEEYARTVLIPVSALSDALRQKLTTVAIPLS